LYASGFFLNQWIGSKKFEMFLYDDGIIHFINSSFLLPALCIDQT